MKIGFLLSSFYPATGGRETITFNQARELARRGHEVHVFTSLTNGLKKRKLLKRYTYTEARHGLSTSIILNLIRAGYGM